MIGKRFVVRLGLVALLIFGPGLAPRGAAQIQNGNQWPTPRLTVVTPNGGKVGTTFEVSFAGTEIEEPTALIFSHPGIKGTPVIPPLPPLKIDPKTKKPDPKQKAPVRPPITRISVSIDKSVPLGYYDVRLVNKNGVSNPRRFVVGDLVEVAEKEPNNDVEQAQKIDIGTTITGAITAGTDVDYCTFAGKKGQHVVISCLTASIDSRLDTEIRVYNPKGVEIAYHRAGPGQDGVVNALLADDGDYLVRLNKFTYTAGSAEYFYRLSISTAPYIEAVFPTMIEPGKSAAITLIGRNLPGGKVDPSQVVGGQALETLTVNVTAPKDPVLFDQLNYSGLVSPISADLNGFEYRLTGPTGTSNPVLITYARAPVVLENDDNDSIEKAQVVPTPCEIAGRINKKRDRDWYVFDAKKGEVLMIDVVSHRLGAPTDMYFVLKNLATKQDIALQDDSADNLSQRFFTVHRDPAPYRFVVPADGKYHLMVASHTGDNNADATNVYQVRISREMPDFHLFVMPSEEFRPDSVRLGQGGADHFTVYARRHDGFKGEILLTIEGLPAGVTCPPQTLGGTMKLAQFVVLAADNAAEFTGSIRVVGTAVIQGKKVTHQARPATVTWPVQINQNIPTITRLDRELVLAVRGKAPGNLVAGVTKLVASHGEKKDIPLKLRRVSPDFKGNLQVVTVPGEFPVGVTFGNLTFAPGKDDLKAVVNVAANTAPGTYSLVFRGFAPISPQAKGKPVNTILVSTPVELTVLPKDVATLSVAAPTVTIKTGTAGDVVVRVARKYDFEGAFKVELVLPPNVKGISAGAVTIAPGANEAKMSLQIAPGTPPANLQNLTLRATAVVHANVMLNHEVKFNVVVAK